MSGCIVVKWDNTEIKTNTLILTFNTPKIPDSLKICYLNIPVSQYVLINCGEKHASYNKKCNFYKSEYDIQHIRVSKNISFFEARKIHQQSHEHRVMDVAGAVNAPTQNTSISTQTDVSWVGPGPVTWKQRPAVSVTNRPVTSVTRSVCTTTRVTDLKKTAAPARLSPPKKGGKSTKPSSPK